MSQEFFDLLARLAPVEKPERLQRTAQELDVLVSRLAAILQGLGDSRAQHELLAHFGARSLDFLVKGKDQPQAIKPSPEVMEWARNQFTEEEIVAGLREIRATGGLELQDFIHELEQAMGRRE